jgi:hypothetical protein
MYFDAIQGDEVNCAVVINDMVFLGGSFNLAGNLPVNNIVGCTLNGSCVDTLEGGLPNQLITQMICIFQHFFT